MRTRPILSCQEMITWEESELHGDTQLAGQWMNLAALGMARWVLGRYHWRYCIILAGFGGNGGDAWALARLLKKAGWDPLVVYFETEHPLTLQQITCAKAEGVRSTLMEDFLAQKPSTACDLIIDGLLGIGARPGLPLLMQEAICWANDWPATRIALDCPTGWQTPALSFLAHHTLCIHLLKKELLAPLIRECTGELHSIDLGVGLPGSDWQLYDDNLESMIPTAARSCHKYERGVIYVAAGSLDYPGASRLAERGAWWLRPGMVYCESMPYHERSVALTDIPQHLREGSVLIAGPGMARAPSSLMRLQRWLKSAQGCSAMVIDGDALFHLGEMPELWDLLLPRRTLLTPHEGELTRLLKCEGFDVAQTVTGRIDQVMQLCEKRKIFLIYKGPVSYLCGPQTTILVEPFGTPRLAIGGSGDLLAGMLGSALSQSLSMVEAAGCSLREHALNHTL